MSESLSSSEIALLCDIGEYDLAKASEEQKRDLQRLLAGGFVEPAADRPASGYQPTRRGMEALGERGAGLNEA